MNLKVTFVARKQNFDVLDFCFFKTDSAGSDVGCSFANSSSSLPQKHSKSSTESKPNRQSMKNKQSSALYSKLRQREEKILKVYSSIINDTRSDSTRHRNVRINTQARDFQIAPINFNRMNHILDKVVQQRNLYKKEQMDKINRVINPMMRQMEKNQINEMFSKFACYCSTCKDNYGMYIWRITHFLIVTVLLFVYF